MTDLEMEAKAADNGWFPRIVQRVSSHLPGADCRCAAYSESECGCPGVDWRSRREVALEHCLLALKSHHATRPGIAETIRQTEMIKDAGNFQSGR